MKDDQTDTQTALRKLLGATEPPAKITQDPYDGNERQLRRLARLKPGEESRFDDLYLYVKALRFTKIDTAFFVYMLPVFLDLGVMSCVVRIAVRAERLSTSGVSSPILKFLKCI